MRAWHYVLYACGQVGMMCLARFFFQWNMEYAREPVGDGFLLAPALLGLLLFGFRIFDGVTDPVAGIISDRWVRRGRQRRHLLLFAFALPVVGLALIFRPDREMAEPLRWALATGGMFVFFVGYTVYAIPYWSLVADYSGDDHDVRRRLSNSLGTGMLVATAIIAVASPAVVVARGYFEAALWVGIPATLLMVLPFFAQPGPQPAAAAPAGPEPTLGEMLGTAFKDRRFLAVLVLFSGSQMSFTVMTAGAPAIASEVLGGTAGDVPRLLGPFLLGAFPFFVLVPTLSRRLGWERAVVVASLALGVVYAGTRFLDGEAPSPFLTAGLLFACAGPMAAVLLGLEGEAVTTCARESKGELTAIYFGMLNLVVKAMNGLAVFLTGVVLEQQRFGLIGPLAGALLWAGVAGYFVLRPRGGRAAPAA
ncbi:MAG: MFS transporter [Planctomycetes bacterium]|nr:MFS transporter [Planctomycetota bacterium]